MKTYLFSACLFLMLFLSNVAKAQSYFRLYIDGNYYLEGSTVYLKCNGLNSYINAQYEYNSNLNNQATVSRADVLTLPRGYTTSNDPDLNTLVLNKNTPQDGDFSIVVRGYYLPPSGHTITVHFRTTPVISFVSQPTLGNNQSGTAQVYVDPSYNPNTPYTSVNWSTTYGLQVNGGTSYSSGNTGDYNSQTISATGSGGRLYVSATNACGTSPAIVSELGPPFIENPNLTLFYAGSNTWQFTQIWHSPATTYLFYVAAGSATLSQNTGDCYISTQEGASVCVTGTNANGTSTPYCFYVPEAGGGGYMRAPFPNPAKDQLTLHFTNTESLKSLPSTVYLYAENATVPVKSVSIADVYSRRGFEKGDKISMPVGDLPRGVYYIHAIPNGDFKSPSQRIRVVLE